jgi:monofunctional biosynthetic peptidoglycan transglycosylase
MAMERASAGRRLARASVRIVRWSLVGVLGYLILCIVLTALYAVVPPPQTGIQLQRRVERLFAGESPSLTWTRVPSERIDPDLPHAVVAAEDGRFYQHHGIDFEAIRETAEDNRRPGRRQRGGSTITQQLVKNLFMTTRGGWVRKAFEVPLALVADLVLGKERQLELYLNVAEWGPGIFGAEEAARYHYGKSARNLTREEAAGLAALLPAPRTRTVARTGWYRTIILERMRQMGY